MIYVVNNNSGPIFLNDIKKVIPYDPTGRKVFPFSERELESSEELRSKINSGIVVNVTRQHLEEIENAANSNRAPSQYIGLHGEPVEQQSNYQPTSRSNSVLVDIDESSRVYGASDSHLHTANYKSGSRAGADTGLFVDEYETNEQRARAERQKNEVFVENDSRANPVVDPRFFRKTSSYSPADGAVLGNRKNPFAYSNQNIVNQNINPLAIQEDANQANNQTFVKEANTQQSNVAINPLALDDEEIANPSVEVEPVEVELSEDQKKLLLGEKKKRGRKPKTESKSTTKKVASKSGGKKGRPRKVTS